MARYIIRSEGVNLRNVLDDTNDLSTRRGGGLMILNAPAQLLESSLLDDETKKKLKPIATGASIGLYEFEAENDEDAEKIFGQVDKFFREGNLFYNAETSLPDNPSISLLYATFVTDFEKVDIKPDASEADIWIAENHALSSVTAKNRKRQLRERSFSLKGVADNFGNRTGPCEIDFVRPAVSNVKLADGMTGMSESVQVRRNYGRYARQAFYHNELKLIGKSGHFTDDFHELAQHSQGAKHRLNGKMAVFFVDGNGFGKISQETILNGGFVKLNQWSDGLKVHHRNLLRRLLERACKDKSWITTGDKIQLETLLWGGDELIWVVPAWKGWELASWFFSESHQVGGKELTYSCGLVFCRCKAPIRNVIDLAHRLAEIAKSYSKDANNKTQHRLAYEVLESFDDIPNDLATQRSKWLPRGLSPACLTIQPTMLKLIMQKIVELTSREEFPKGQLYEAVRAWRSGRKDEMKKAIGRMKERVSEAVITDFLGVFGAVESEASFLHLLQMMDYVEAVPAIESETSEDLREEKSHA